MSFQLVFSTIFAGLSLLLLIGLLILVYEAIGALRVYNLQHGSRVRT